MCESEITNLAPKRVDEPSQRVATIKQAVESELYDGFISRLFPYKKKNANECSAAQRFHMLPGLCRQFDAA